jgi:CheY-specific phosphatase CheX
MEVRLKTKHIIMLSKVVSKMNLAIDLKDKSQTEIGVDIVFGILSNVHKAEKEFYELLSSLSGKTVDTIADMELNELKDALMATIKEVTNFMKPAV